MESHPSYPPLAAFLEKYPEAGSSFFQTYNDLKLGQRWKDIEVVELEDCSRIAIRGIKPGMESHLHVVPCSLTELISLSWLQKVFTELSNPPEVYLAITSDDSSIVYYKISSGVVKPPI